MIFKHSKLHNGLNIITLEIPGLKSVNVSFWFKRGSRDEGENEESYHHLLEHCLLSGSQNYPDEFKIAQLIKDTGSYLNAHSDSESICLESDILIGDLKKIFNLLTDASLNPLLSKKIIEREAKIINEELLRKTTFISKTINFYSELSMYNKTDLAKISYGQTRNIQKIDIKKIKDLHKQIINPKNMAIISVGGVNHEKIKKIAQKNLGHVKNKEIPVREKQEAKPTKINPPKSQTITKSVRFCLPAVSYNDPEIYSFFILNSFLSGGQDSILYQELRRKGGLVYSIYANNSYYSDMGYWFIDFTSSKSSQVINRLKKIISEINLTEKDLERAKKRIINQRKRLISSDYYWTMSIMGKNFSCGVIESPRQFEKHINKVTMKDIKKVLEKYILNKKPIMISN